MPKLVLVRPSAAPLQQQLHDQLRAAIMCGSLRSGDRIPSTRMMAKLLKVSRNTVVAAYDALVLEGLLLPVERCCFCVTSPVRGPLSGRFAWRVLAAAAQLPVRIYPFEDPDGNGLYFNGA